MKHIISLLCVLFIIGCSKEKATYHPTHEELIGKKFASTTAAHYVQFLSADSLLWMIGEFRETPISYKIKYDLMDDRVRFELRDTIKLSRDSQNISYSVSYHYDSFDGVFTNKNTISSTMYHTRKELLEDENEVANGSVTTSFDLYYTK